MAFIRHAICLWLLTANVDGLTIDVAKTLVDEVTDRTGVRVVGGRSSHPHAHPYQVSLQHKLLWARFHVCGGCVLTDKWAPWGSGEKCGRTSIDAAVMRAYRLDPRSRASIISGSVARSIDAFIIFGEVLTAGHCLVSSWLTWLMPLDVVAGAHDINAKEGTVQVSRAKYKLIHPLYNHDVGPNDIGLVQVKHPFRWTRWVRPARLPTRNDAMPARATLTGWGSTSTGYWPDFPGLLQVIDLPIMKYQECYGAVQNVSDSEDPNPLDEDSNICTAGGQRAAGGAACIGDSGGPLVMAASGATVTTLHSSYSSASTHQGVTTQSNPTQISTVQAQSSTNEDEETNLNPIEPVSCGRAVTPDPPYVPPVVIGVVSWGLLPCGSDDAPSVYTKVSNFLDYIESHVEL